MRTLSLSALILSLAACQAPTPDPSPGDGYLGPPAQVDLSSCGGNALHGLVGRDIDELPAAGGWGTLRVIKPGMAVTEDYSATRLNVELNGEDTITAVHCG